MAVQRKKKTEEVKVEEPVVAEVEEEVTEEPIEEPAEEEVETVDIPEEPEKKDDVVVYTESLKVDEDKIPEEPEKKVKIRMRVDHNCTIAMENYDLKQGKTYDVPKDVKRILEEAGLLAPL